MFDFSIDRITLACYNDDTELNNTKTNRDYMTNTQHKDGSALTHAFTAAGLGNAPFTFIGMRENVFAYPDGTSKAGGTCAYCGTGIRNEFIIRSACGRVSTVGCDCIRRVDDVRLVVAIASAERLHSRKLRNEAKKRKEAAARAEIEQLDGAYKLALVALAHKPHPNAYFAANGKSLADYFTFFYNPQFQPLKTLECVKIAIAKAEGK